MIFFFKDLLIVIKFDSVSKFLNRKIFLNIDSIVCRHRNELMTQKINIPA